MAVETLQSRTLRAQLDNGTDSEGKQLYLAEAMNVLGGISISGWDGDKALAVVEALEPCLTKTVSFIETGTTSRLSAE